MDAEAIFQAINEFEDIHDLAAARTGESYSITKKRQLAEAIWHAQSWRVQAETSSVITS